jgi:hypothetical protein
MPAALRRMLVENLANIVASLNRVPRPPAIPDRGVTVFNGSPAHGTALPLRPWRTVPTR